MTLVQVAQILDVFASSFAFGATVWFFFVQSPVLLKRLGRETFVPIQMGLTVTLFQVLTVRRWLCLLRLLFRGAPSPRGR